MDTVQIRKIFQDMKTGGVEGRGAVFLFRDKKLSFSHNVGKFNDILEYEQK